MEIFSNHIFYEMMKDPSNLQCFDCNKSNPDWVSLNNAIFICLECAGQHRSIGLNLSVVRSITLDVMYQLIKL